MTIETLINNAREDLKIDPGKVIWTDDQLVRWANEAISFIYAKGDFKFEFKTGTINPLVDGTAAYTMPSDYGHMLWAKLVDTTAASTGADEEELTIITDTLIDFQKTYDMDAEGDKPGYIYEEDGEIKVYPVPNAAAAAQYTVKYKYAEYPDTYTTADTPDFPSEWHFIVEHYVRYKAWSSVPGQQNQQNAQMALSEWDRWSPKAIADMLHRENEGLTFRAPILPSKRRK